MNRDSEARFRALIADGWTPAPLIALTQWIAEHVVLPQSVSATPGRYDLEAYPYWRGVIEQAENPETEKIVILASTQLGKTTLAIALMLALSYLSPAPGMFATPDRDSGRELREKIYAIAEASGFADDLPPPRLRNDRWIDLSAARWHSGIAFNTQTLSGKSCQRVFKTELSRWRRRKNFGDPKLIADERVKAFFRSLILEEGTPSDESCSISASYDASDRRRLHVPCPACNHFQDLRPFPLKRGPYAGFGGIAGVKTRDGNWVSPDEALEKAFYRCERGCHIDNGQKEAMIRDGIWVPKGQHIGRGGKLEGVPLRGPRVAGFRLNAMYAQTVSFGRMIATFIERRGKQASLQTWWNDWAGQRYTKRGQTPKWRQLWARLRGENLPGTVPSWALFLTAGVDPGKGYCRVTIRAWGEGGRSQLVAWDTTHANDDRRLGHLKALQPQILERDWQLAEPNELGAASLRVALVAVDVGHMPHRVHEWVRSLPAELRKRVRQVAGKTDLPDGAPWRKRLVKFSVRTGKRYAGGGQRRYEINRALYTGEMHDRWRLPADDPAAWRLNNADLGQAELYLQELTNEAPVRRADARGRMRTYWEKIKKHLGNHSSDAECYDMAAADMLVNRNWLRVAARVKHWVGVSGTAERKETKASPPAKRPAPRQEFLHREGGWV
ncbi:MAG TPA: terminase gpA endonuclease subunit [Pirellulales bacterium]|nr:terminase gpA endonuclease subunit [Pirellulales bacterium]